jgi:hypothetical protein
MAVPTMIETSRVHSATGAFGSVGGQITAATNAAPIVVTTTSAHGLAVGDRVQVSGITTNTGADGNFPVTVVGSATTFTLGGSTGNGVAGVSASSIVSEAVPISAVTGDWTLRMRIEGMLAGLSAEVAIEDSVDGITWITRVTRNVKGAVLSGAMLDVMEVRKYDFPSIRFGTANAVIRVNVLSLDATNTVTVTAWFEA